VAGDALVVPGSIGGAQVEAMLCDSGATICVVSEQLLLEGTERLEKVWVGTVDVEPRPYPTAIMPAMVQGKELEVFAAIMPAERLPSPVILGRYIPGKKVVWSMKVTDEHGTVFQLTQETGVNKQTTNPSSTVTNNRSEESHRDRPNQTVRVDKQTSTVSVAGTPTVEGGVQQAQTEQSRTKPKSRRKRKFHQASEESEGMTEKHSEIVKEKQGEIQGHGVVAGETASQVVEESAGDAPLSPTGKEMWIKRKSVPKKVGRFKEGPPKEIGKTCLDVAVVSGELSHLSSLVTSNICHNSLIS